MTFSADNNSSIDTIDMRDLTADINCYMPSCENFDQARDTDICTIQLDPVKFPHAIPGPDIGVFCYSFDFAVQIDEQIIREMAAPNLSFLPGDLFVKSSSK